MVRGGWAFADGKAMTLLSASHFGAVTMRRVKSARRWKAPAFADSWFNSLFVVLFVATPHIIAGLAISARRGARNAALLLYK